MRQVYYQIRIILLLLIGAIAVTHAATLEEIVEKQAPLSYGGKVILKNVNGRVTIEGWDKEEFSMRAEKRVEAASRSEAEKVMAELKVIFEKKGDEINIRTRVPRSEKGGMFDWLFGSDVQTNVNYTIYLPQKCSLRISNTNGSLEITAVKGEMRLETTNGKIVANNIAGSVNMRTTNGSILADLHSFSSDGEMEFTTTNGSIKLYLPEKSSFNVRANTTNGSIDSDFPLSIEGKYTNKRVEGTVNGGGPLVFMETTNGSIHIRER